MRKLTVIFIVLIALLQYPLWLGKGSWSRVWQYSQQIEAHEKRNDYYRQRNETLRAEVRDLKQGQSAVEERARSELGMIKQDEVFYQVMQRKNANPPASNGVVTNVPSKESIVNPGTPDVPAAIPEQ
ncbi:cell division protein FtsB [Methylophilus sp. Leaf408]|uniref:cell division protein FtsB n=1 Tax=Methylophilus sp. Leaf408 TaxID=2876561 RepID=UPI001E5C8546|nr:cell division protein FtsB [Methylophilus sp. Leaf408]